MKRAARAGDFDVVAVRRGDVDVGAAAVHDHVADGDTRCADARVDVAHCLHVVDAEPDVKPFGVRRAFAVLQDEDEVVSVV